MSTPRVTITTATGQVVTGAVQGCGGMVGGGSIHLGAERASEIALERVRAAIEAANEGRGRHSMASPPGVAWVYPQHCACGNGPRVEVDLRGAMASRACVVTGEVDS